VIVNVLVCKACKALENERISDLGNRLDAEMLLLALLNLPKFKWDNLDIPA
jgi:hypothetical protein